MKIKDIYCNLFFLFQLQHPCFMLPFCPCFYLNQCISCHTWKCLLICYIFILFVLYLTAYLSYLFVLSKCLFVLVSVYFPLFYLSISLSERMITFGELRAIHQVVLQSPKNTFYFLFAIRNEYLMAFENIHFFLKQSLQVGS